MIQHTPGVGAESPASTRLDDRRGAPLRSRRALRVEQAGRVHAVAAAQGSALTGAAAGAPRTADLDAAYVAKAGLPAVCLVALAVAVVNLSNPEYLSLNGDMSRYLMNGVFLRDLLADRPFGGAAEVLEYVRLYFARYPALSLGHHPVLLAVFEAPMFALFGVSVAAARLVPLLALIAATACLYLLVKPRYGPVTAFVAGAVFATSPMIAVSSRLVMAEMPALALALASACLLERYSATGSRRALAACGAAMVLAVYTKPHVLLLAPGLVLAFAAAGPLRRLLRRELLATGAIVAALCAPAVIGPLLLSRFNVAGLTAVARFDSQLELTALLRSALSAQLAWPVLMASAVAVAAALARRDRRAVLFVAWVVGVAPALYLFGGANGVAPRYTMYWIPALGALAAAALSASQHLVVRGAVAVALAAGVCMQLFDRHTIESHIEGAGGYEEAARFVLASNPGPTVLFSGDVDTGYFVFFVRKHDALRRTVVLRSDKVFTTSRMGRMSVEDRISRREEIYEVLHRFGTRYVVLEDRPSRSHVLEWLREEVKTPRFVERWRTPIRTRDPRLRQTALAVYELLDARAPDPDAVLSMRMPLVGQSLAVPLRDLMERKLLR